MQTAMFHLMQYRDLDEDFEERYDTVWVDAPWWELADPAKVSDYYNWSLDEMLFAAEQGMDGICTNEHHQNAYGFQPNPNMMGSILSKVTNMKGWDDTAIIQMGATLPSHPLPNQVAEEYAMLDMISRGRLVAGLPLGTSMDVNQCYGIPPLEQRERYREAHDFIIEAWTRDEIFAFNGEYFQLPKVNLWPRPLQQPHPPVWIPGSGSQTTQEFTLENDYCYCFLSNIGYTKAKRMIDQWWERVDEHGRSMNPFRLGHLQLVTVAESDEKAEELYADHVEYFFHKMLHVPGHYWALPGHLYHEDMMVALEKRAEAGFYSEDEDDIDISEMSYPELVEEGNVISGSPQTVADRLKDEMKELRVGNLMVQLPIGSMPHDLTKKNIALFANEVKPALDDLWEDEWENHWWPEPLRESQEVVAE